MSESHCFLAISIAGHPSRTIVIQLFPDICPQTCENFVQLCSSPVTTSKLAPQPSYRGTEFHRILDGFMVQGGDFVAFDGTGGYSPLTGSTLPDESFAIRHDRPGRVSMANRGLKHTSGSQFFITLAATNHLDGKHVCFGQVVEGMDVVQAMTMVERDGSRPVTLQRIVVVDCGVGKGNCKGETTSRTNANDNDVRNIKDKRKEEKRRKRDESSTTSSDESRERRRKRKKQKHRHRTNYDSSSEERQHRRSKNKKRRDSDSNDSSDVSVEPREKKQKLGRRR
jgi:cyclophilin family peptidyl-prolyl cis-trans isomerase